MISWYGKKLTLGIGGSSHSQKLTAELGSLPEGACFDMAELTRLMARRAPGRSPLSSARVEPDEPVFTAGTEALPDGKYRLTGEKLLLEIPNLDARREEYEARKNIPRPGHADYTAYVKTGEIPPGGGAFSGRMTAALTAAGGICLQLLSQKGISICGRIVEIGGLTEQSAYEAAILAAKAEGDSLGGAIEIEARGLPIGLGGALFDGLEGRISALLFAVPAVKGVEFGEGFRAARLKGSENNDGFALRDGKVVLTSNHAGGILGGISDGAPLIVRAAVKPTPSIAKPQHSVDLLRKEEVSLSVKGRHDPCIVPRAVPVMEAAVAVALLDALLEEKR